MKLFFIYHTYLILYQVTIYHYFKYCSVASCSTVVLTASGRQIGTSTIILLFKEISHFATLATAKRDYQNGEIL